VGGGGLARAGEREGQSMGAEEGGKGNIEGGGKGGGGERQRRSGKRGGWVWSGAKQEAARARFVH
jgi:hypothetical protein